MSICERASRSVPSATARRSQRSTVRMTPIAIGLGERVRVRRQERLERMGHRVDAGGRRDDRRQPDGQARIEDRRLRQQAGMADVALASGRLVRDHAEAVGLGPGPRGRRDRDEGPAGRQVRAVVLEVPDRHRIHRQQVQRLGGIHRRTAADRDDDRAVQPEVAQGRGAALDGGRRPGSVRRPRTRRRPRPRPGARRGPSR